VRGKEVSVGLGERIRGQITGGQVRFFLGPIERSGGKLGPGKRRGSYFRS
jgi:hypothetical protein